MLHTTLIGHRRSAFVCRFVANADANYILSDDGHVTDFMVSHSSFANIFPIHIPVARLSAGNGDATTLIRG